MGVFPPGDRDLQANDVHPMELVRPQSVEVEPVRPRPRVRVPGASGP